MNYYRSQLDTVGWALCSVAVLVVGTRSYCRYFLIRSFGAEDALMVLALVRPCVVCFAPSSLILGYWYCYDCSRLSRSTLRLRPAPRRHQRCERSRKGVDVHLCCAVSLYSCSNIWQDFNGSLPRATTRPFSQEATPVVSVFSHSSHGWSPHIRDWHLTGRLLTNAKGVNSNHAGHMHQSRYV